MPPYATLPYPDRTTRTPVETPIYDIEEHSRHNLAIISLFATNGIPEAWLPCHEDEAQLERTDIAP